MIKSRGLALLVSVLIGLAAGVGWPLPAPAQEEKAASQGKVNINTASRAELMKLNGIGPAVADKIIEYRKTHGAFGKPEDIRKIQGIGKGLWERNRDTITVK